MVLVTARKIDKTKAAVVAAACVVAVTGIGVWVRRKQLQKRMKACKALTGLLFDLTEKEIEEETEKIIAKMKEVDDEIASLSENAITFSNTAQKLIDLDAEILSRVTNVTFLGHVSASKEIRDACTKADEKIEDFLVKRGMRADVYKVLKHLSSSKSAQV
jgi:Zn-dependent oligopeptidase